MSGQNKLDLATSTTDDDDDDDDKRKAPPEGGAPLRREIEGGYDSFRRL
jgi:hypothetical protein